MPRLAARAGALQPSTSNVTRTARLAGDDCSWVGTDIQKSRKDDGGGRLDTPRPEAEGATTHSGNRRQTGGDCFGARWRAHRAGGAMSSPDPMTIDWSEHPSTGAV